MLAEDSFEHNIGAGIEEARHASAKVAAAARLSRWDRNGTASECNRLQFRDPLQWQAGGPGDGGGIEAKRFHARSRL